MLGKVCVCSKLLVIVVSLLVSVANLRKEQRSQQCDAAFCTLSGSTLDPLIKSQLLYQLS